MRKVAYGGSRRYVERPPRRAPRGNGEMDGPLRGCEPELCCTAPTPRLACPNRRPEPDADGGS